jgi:hypothetical protein
MGWILRLKLLKALTLKPMTPVQVFVILYNREREPLSWGELDLSSSRQTDLQWWGIEDSGLRGALIIGK